MEKKLLNQRRLLKLRTELKRDTDGLKKFKKYTSVLEYNNGASFGELALMFDQPRAASIFCTKPCFFLTIHKEDYQNHVNRFAKKQKEQLIE
jgi:CRP-like cAMP-binding protein